LHLLTSPKLVGESRCRHKNMSFLSGCCAARSKTGADETERMQGIVNGAYAANTPRSAETPRSSRAAYCVEVDALKTRHNTDNQAFERTISKLEAQLAVASQKAEYEKKELRAAANMKISALTEDFERRLRELQGEEEEFETRLSDLHAHIDEAEQSVRRKSTPDLQAQLSELHAHEAEQSVRRKSLPDLESQAGTGTQGTGVPSKASARLLAAGFFVKQDNAVKKDQTAEEHWTSVVITNIDRQLKAHTAGDNRDQMLLKKVQQDDAVYDAVLGA